MALDISLNLPQFLDEYDGVKMRQLIEEIERFHALLTADTVDGVRTGEFDILESTNLFVRESSAGRASRVGWGQFWVDDAAPNIPMFTDDAGNVFQLSRVGYGGIHVAENTTVVNLNSSGSTQITWFDTDDPSSDDVTPDNTNDHIIVGRGGDYLVRASITVKNNASQTHIIHVGMHTNNRANEFMAVHAHRTMSGGVTDIGFMGVGGIVTLSAGDTVELWADSDSASDRSVTFEDISLSVVRVS